MRFLVVGFVEEDDFALIVDLHSVVRLR
jgi:hypothetical protein